MARVLVIRAGAIGDFVLTLPLLEAILSDDPLTEIEILGRPNIAELAVGRRLATAAHRVDGMEWAGLFAPDGMLADAERKLLNRFDRVFCVWPDRDGIIQNNLRRAGVRDLVYLNPMPPEHAQVHAVECLAQQCGKAGLVIKYMEPHLYPSLRDQRWVERYMRVTGAGHKRILGMNPGSGSAKKNWPAKKYAEVARNWIERREGHVLVFCGPADDEAVAGLLLELPDEPAFTLRNEPLPRVAAALERCAAFVGNDSGITQMAAAVRTPTVAIFGPTDPRVWQPLAPKVSVVSAAEHGHNLDAVPASIVIERIDGVMKGVMKND